MVLYRNQFGATLANLSIKNVPDELLVGLRARAKLNHRSLQGELMSILEEAVRPNRLTVQELHNLVLSSDLKTGLESVAMVREDRDAR